MTFAAASLVGTVRPFDAFFVDFDGDPIYASTLGVDWQPSGTGDADLDGQTYFSLPPELLDVSDIDNAEEGTGTVRIRLSGLPTENQDLLDAIADPAKWRGRLFRAWKGLTNASFVPSVVAPKFTGYMMSVRIGGDSQQQTIELTCETYLSILANPRRRTYQDQGLFDATDNSPALIRAAANGIQSAGGSGFVYIPPPGQFVNNPEFPLREPF